MLVQNDGSNCSFLDRSDRANRSCRFEPVAAGWFLRSPGDPKWPMDLAGCTRQACQTRNLSNGSRNLSCQIKTARIYIFHEWKTPSRNKDDLLAIIAEFSLLDYALCKQTKTAPVLAPCLHYILTADWQKNTCRYWILCRMRIDRITWRKTKPVTTTIILIRPLYRAGMLHMLQRPCWGFEWIIILPSNLTALPCSLPTQYRSAIPGRTAGMPSDSYQ